GLRVLVHEDHSAPVVSSYVFYHVGSRNEVRGATGISHLFEHMMFNGGRKFGPGVFDDLIEGNGGSTNGYTTRDYTAYLNNFPREALPVVLDLESDRMAHLAITKQNLEQERGIVMEERRLRVDDQVSGVMDEELYLHAFEQSPRRWNTIGFMSDIRHITLEEARAFFERCYAPNSARLHEDLVREHELATGVEANNVWGIDPELFYVYAQARPGETAAALEKRIDAVLTALGEKPVPPDELVKAKNQLRADLIRGLKTVSGKANQLGYFEAVLGDYHGL